MRSRSCLLRNFETISGPNVKDTPRSFSPQPLVSLSGSDHNRSHKRPWSGTSVGRMMRRICSIACRSGDKPVFDRKKSQKVKHHMFILGKQEQNMHIPSASRIALMSELIFHLLFKICHMRLYLPPYFAPSIH